MKLENCKSTVLGILTVLFWIHPPVSYASEFAQNSKLISGSSISLIAKGAIADELTNLNQALSAADAFDSEYPQKLLKEFIHQTNKTQIDLDELYGKCAFSNSDLVNLNSPIFRAEDEATATKSKNLQNLGALYGKNVWRLFSKICQLAQIRFEERLESASEQSTPLNFDQEEITRISNILFFPTLVGSAPSRKSEIMNMIFNTSIMSSLVFGPIAALSGIAIGGNFIMVATATNMSHGLLGEMASVFHLTQNKDLGDLISKSPLEINIDLNAKELALDKSAK